MPISSLEHWQRIAKEVERKAAVFADDPGKGRRAGYRPEPGRLIPAGYSTGGLDDAPPMSERDPYAAWLHGVARRDLRGCKYQIIDNPEAQGGFEIVIT